ncbi:MAG: (2Fe-2S)-binding protein [Rhodobacteraceae bacterium]|nr:(2Fe-2S)-binding protein [Paracoccaceae bacterium]MCF8512717.1 (2Fe-2S)-binding protein [Paracoccaceae bacterium]MCF8516962.1 (2Fe-2S)-binding protein [Paracoccaceae bacterium]
MTGHVVWHGRRVAFRRGESLASALMAAGVHNLGQAATGQARGVFCGIGQCQNCLVRVGDRLTEACLLICEDGLIADPDAGGRDG